MKKTYLLLLTAIAFLGASCLGDTGGQCPGPEGGEHEIEISIATSAQAQTRTPVPDAGFERENVIDELDLLVFSSTDMFLYRREAYRVGTTNSYKTTMVETADMLTAYVFANCRTLLKAWEVTNDGAMVSWATVQEMLRDADPARVVGTNIDTDFHSLPMWGATSGTVSTTQVNKWGTVQLLRSVASVDLYVEKTDKASKLTLTDLHLYYAPDRGYLAPPPADNANGYEIASPANMTTTLNTLVASDRRTVVYDLGEGESITKDQIVGQMYLYDNTVSGAVTETRRHTRAIVAGYYDQPDPVYDPEEPGVDTRKKYYWPLDFVSSDGVTMRQLLRNWKYVFNITACHGPGYETIEEAAENFPINLGVEVIYWNRDEIEIGVEGQYYVSMERKEARLQRAAGSTDHIKLTYRILDEIAGEKFTMWFKDATNGTEYEITDGIANDYFKVRLVHDVSGKRADLYFEAVKDYTAGHNTDTLVIKFRSLQLEVGITQRDWSNQDWEDGGDTPADL